MLKQRVLSAVVMIGAVLGALFMLPPLPFTFLFAIFISVAMWEWGQFAGVKRPIVRVIIALITMCLFIFPIVATTEHIKLGKFLTDETIPLLFIACLWWTIAFFLVISYPRSARFWAKSASTQIIFAFCTLLPFFISTLALRFYHYAYSPYQGAYLLLYVFILVWGADTGAYFIGRTWGKRKLATKVSPSKSLEGALGGIITVALIAFIVAQYFSSAIFGKEIGVISLVLLSIATALISILGDLVESMFKRQAGIKDSSQLIPGHGGILDRIDSLTAAVPFFALFFFIIL